MGSSMGGIVTYNSALFAVNVGFILDAKANDTSLGQIVVITEAVFSFRCKIVKVFFLAHVSCQGLYLV